MRGALDEPSDSASPRVEESSDGRAGDCRQFAVDGAPDLADSLEQCLAQGDENAHPFVSALNQFAEHRPLRLATESMELGVEEEQVALQRQRVIGQLD